MELKDDENAELENVPELHQMDDEIK